MELVTPATQIETGENQRPTGSENGVHFRENVNQRHLCEILHRFHRDNRIKLRGEFSREEVDTKRGDIWMSMHPKAFNRFRRVVDNGQFVSMLR